MELESRLIIFEGLDRTGKDTQIKLLCDKLKAKEIKFEIIHFSYPSGETLSDKIHNNFIFFKEQFNRVRNEKDTIFIWNRSHVGELVYGKKYRSSEIYNELFYNAEIYILESLYKDVLDSAILFLLSSDINLLVKLDDGNSFSSDLNDKETEYNMFLSAYNATLIKNKVEISVYNNEKNKMFSKKDIHNQIYNKCKQTINFL